eukprot:3952419-Lingulodinium_polyedra.AAC.1
MPASRPDDWRLEHRWHEHLSDHALLRARPGLRCGGSRPPCTPAAFKQLPPEAIEDFRRAYRGVEVTL